MNTNAAAVLTLTVRAHWTSWNEDAPRFPGSVEFVTPDRATEAEAEADASLFPKGAKLRVQRCGHCIDGGPDTYRARARIDLMTDGANHGINETGIRRLRTIYRAADKAGMTLTFDTRSSSSYDSREDLEAGLAAQAVRPVEA